MGLAVPCAGWRADCAPSEPSAKWEQSDFSAEKYVCTEKSISRKEFFNLNMTKLPVPYISQRKAYAEPHWQERTCGLLALLSAIYFLKRTSSPTPEEFLEKALALGARDPRFGWIHERLLLLAKEEGVVAHRKEYKSKDFDTQIQLKDIAIKEFAQSLDKGVPVIISTHKGWQEEGGFHQVLLAGFKGEKGHPEAFYVHDSDSLSEEEGAYQEIPVEAFKKGFRGLAIFVGL